MIPILMYHQVAEIPRELDPVGLSVSPHQFSEQMGYLARKGFHCLSLAQAVQSVQKGLRPPPRSFVLTFDDGYQDIFSTAGPILENYDFTATIFLVAGRMGSESNWWGQDQGRSGKLLSWGAARELAQKGYTLGSHTLSHPFLNLLDESAALMEIRDSKLCLQDQLGIQVDFFSYPFSETNARIEGLVQSAGYTAACAGDLGAWSLFHLWRVPCGRNDTALSFAMKAGGWYNHRTALRESPPGRLLRSSIHLLRRWLKIPHPKRQDILNRQINIEPKKTHD